VVTTPDSSSQLMLVGFIGDFSGSQPSLQVFRPVVARDGERFAALRGRWSLEDLEPIHETQYHYITVLHEEPINEGDVVWIVNDSFRSRVSDIDELRALSNGMMRWRQFENLYAFTIGTAAAFQEFSNQLYAGAVRALHYMLFDPSASSNGAAQSAFDVISSVHYSDRRDQQIQRGLYYNELRDEHRYSMVRKASVLDGFFDMEEHYDSEVTSLRDFLNAERLRELSPVWSTPWTGDDSTGLGLAEASQQFKFARSRAAEILRFPSYPLLLVLGTYRSGAHLTYALADLTASRFAAAAGVPSDVDVQGPIPVHEIDESARRNNLLLIGSSKQNDLTRDVLSHEATRAIVSCEFRGFGYRDGDGPEIPPQLHLNNQVYGSKELKTLKRGERSLADFALLAKLPNPFNPDATVLIVAGQHALGTEGAAQFLGKWTQWKTHEFEQKVGAGYFGAVIFVEAERTDDKLIFTDVRDVDESLTKIGF
jgi:hypothetical protein